MTIYFYIPNDKFGEFSNSANFGIELDGKWWKTIEHYFQAQKFNNDEFKEKIRITPSAKAAVTLGRSREFPLREDWEHLKDEVMRKAVLKKFQTHRVLRELLVSTKSEKIIEAAPGDYYWGAGQDGSGMNMLGIILEEIRDSLKV